MIVMCGKGKIFDFDMIFIRQTSEMRFAVVGTVRHLEITLGVFNLVEEAEKFITILADKVHAIRPKVGFPTKEMRGIFIG